MELSAGAEQAGPGRGQVAECPVADQADGTRDEAPAARLRQQPVADGSRAVIAEIDPDDPSLRGGLGGSMPSVWNPLRPIWCCSLREKPGRLLPLARAVLRLGLLRLLGVLRLLVHRDPPGMPVGRGDSRTPAPVGTAPPYLRRRFIHPRAGREPASDRRPPGFGAGGDLIRRLVRSRLEDRDGPSLLTRHGRRCARRSI
jgi:hypothetical protein